MSQRQRPKDGGAAHSRNQPGGEAQAYLSAVVESSDDAIITKDLNGTITSWNRAAERIFGHLEREVVGKHISVIIPAERLAEEAEILSRMRTGHRVEHFETVRRTKDGRLIEVAITVSPIKDSTGRVIGASKIARDITERRSEERRRKFLSDATTALSLSLDLRSTCQTIVRATIPTLADFACLDLVTPDVIERTAWAHRSLPPEEFDAIGRFTPPRISVSHPVSRALSSGRAEFVPNVDRAWIQGMAVSAAHAQFLTKMKLKSLITVLLAARGKVLGALTLYLSEGDRRHTRDDVALAEDFARRASEALENALLYRDAQQAVDERDRFISIASHELRTPLTTLQLQLQGALRSLKKKKGADAWRQALLQVGNAERQGAKIARLVHELLDVTRITAGKLELQLESFDLAELTRGVVEHFAAELTQKKIAIDVIAPQRVRGRWDRFRLDQVITNLISNAIKYGGGTPIEVSVAQEANRAILTVADGGPGIEKTFLKKLFRPFEQGESAERTGGLGLGLFISRKIVESHGGAIDVESRPGEGSKFRVELPRELKS